MVLFSVTTGPGRRRTTVLCLLVTLAQAQSNTISIPLDLSPSFNIKAASTGVDDPLADFDGSGRAYAAELLPEGTFSYNGIEFVLPPFKNTTALDAVRAASQVIPIPTSGGNATYQSFHGLAAATWTPSGFSQANAGNVTFTFVDGSSANEGIIVAPWYGQSPFNGPVATPWHFANATLDWNETVDYNVTHLHYVTLRVPNALPLKSITLPTTDAFLTFFAITLRSTGPEPASSNSDNATGPVLGVQSVRSTTKWFDDGKSKPTGAARIQQIEVLLDNLSPLNSPLSSWITAAHTINIASSSLRTVIPGSVKRLRSNDQALIKVGVQNTQGVEAGTSIHDATVVVSDSSGEVVFRSESWELTAGIPLYENNDGSLGTHETPEWWEDAKFGIFIHWGVYSVPAWAPSGQQYAEWYNWQFHNPPNSDSPTWVHHLATYGPDVIYDDFIANFTASKWNPDDWTDLFADSGAGYFVLVTKHHDGFALFDTGNSSDRNSVKMGPKRDILRELMQSAKTRHPELHRGTYFSLPEWFNPAYEPFGKEKFPGKPAHFAFNNSCCEPYTGYIPKEDFIHEVQQPQMEKLFYEYETDILWCDEDGKSIFPEIAGDWYNYAASQGRQVVRNNRCGANQTDFVTPEYATFAAQLSQKWESSEGMDPFSYGYNSNTSSSGYRNASNIILDLVDIVSKGGNFLLDIGPKSDGTVIPEMTTPLRQVGQWLAHSGESIYSTRPWFVKSADTSAGMTDVRFTQTADAFYIIALERPQGGVMQTSAPVPIRKGDRVTLLGDGGRGQELKWDVDAEGVLSVEVGEEELGGVEFAWAFKVEYA